MSVSAYLTATTSTRAYWGDKQAQTNSRWIKFNVFRGPSQVLPDKLHWRQGRDTLSHTQTFNGPFPRLPGWTGTKKVKPIWILLKQETVSGSGISWATMQVCTSLQTDNHASTPPLRFLQAGCLPAAQPTVSKHAYSTVICHTEDNFTAI